MGPRQVGSGFTTCPTYGHSWGFLLLAVDSALFLDQCPGLLSSPSRQDLAVPDSVSVGVPLGQASCAAPTTWTRL